MYIKIRLDNTRIAEEGADGGWHMENSRSSAMILEFDTSQVNTPVGAAIKVR